MPYLQLNDQRLALRAGETRIGVGPDADIALSSSGSPSDAPRLDATVRLADDGVASIRRGTNGTIVRVNGVQLGLEPTPLIHGDKIELGANTLVFGDDQKSGNTQFMEAANAGQLEKPREAPAPKPTPNATGGRVVSLVDGREYQVGVHGLTFGRDVKSDVVLPSADVSRRHAQIEPGDEGYVITDMSTNGLFVNNTRVDSSQVLKRGDVIRMGTEDFRFYADTKAGVVPPSAAPTLVAPAPAGPQIIARPMMDRPEPARSLFRVGPAKDEPKAVPPEAPVDRGSATWFWLVAALLVAAVIYIVWKGH